MIQSDICCTSEIATDPISGEFRNRSLAVFKALADGTRFDVFRLIAAQDGPICACDIVDRFDVSQPTIAHHLKVLREAGLITCKKRGVWAWYEVDPNGLDALGIFAKELNLPSRQFAAIG
jgi:ArsR family transcriptional regulator